jgi:hypothetical protein
VCGVRVASQACDHLGCDSDEVAHLLFVVEGAGHEDVVEDGGAVDFEAVGDGDHSVGTERPLRVDVHHLAVAAALRAGQLTHTERDRGPEQ